MSWVAKLEHHDNKILRMHWKDFRQHIGNLPINGIFNDSRRLYVLFMFFLKKRVIRHETAWDRAVSDAPETIPE